ncbi:OsmC family protein [Aliiglaciecola litoralis]|uniref:OsmC-like protein n=1 Tax=Aliiglaciecola litoralis TaxID=582857 RepID=A0ABP3X084_9ALTE
MNNTTAAVSSSQLIKPSIVSMTQRHHGLVKKYADTPQLAWVTDMAVTGQSNTEIHDALHVDVEVAGLNISLGVHPAVGGDGDAPVPGELLCAALASCLDSTIRIIANRLSVELTHLQVSVSAEIDVRGTLKFNPAVPVAFQKMHVSVEMQTLAGTKPELESALFNAAEASCVVMQTLKHPPQISTQFHAGSV